MTTSLTLQGAANKVVAGSVGGIGAVFALVAML